jgi:hypothetical protein
MSMFVLLAQPHSSIPNVHMGFIATLCSRILFTYLNSPCQCLEENSTEVIRTYAKKHKNRTAQNNNQLIRDLFNEPEIGRRLNRMWPEDLIREPSEDGTCFKYSHPSL